MPSRRPASASLWALLLAAGLTLSARPVASSTLTAIKASAPLGTVVTESISLDNLGQPAVTAYLYEAWPATPATPQSPSRPLRVPLPAEPGPITAQLQQDFAASPDGRADMIIYLADQADLRPAVSIADWDERGEAVYHILTDHAARTQASLLADLRAKGYAPRSFWIVNAILVHGDSSLAHWLATRPEVALIGANVRHSLASGDTAPPSLDAALRGAFSRQEAGGGEIPWGLAKIQAPRVWSAFNIRGQGIVVANIDTGVSYTHTALLTQYRGYSASSLTHDYNWYNPHVTTDTASLAPFDSAGHGTHTMGLMLGGAFNQYAALGVAPSAQWIAARGCSGILCADADLLASAQWVLAPTDLTGENPRPDFRPHILNNSWGDPGGSQWFTGYVEAWNASGLFSVFANGNDGQIGCAHTAVPASYSNAFSAGATDSADYIADFSSRGPTLDGRIKPDLTAPGLEIPSAWPDNQIAIESGTSMAAPHLAGVVALLWSANPLLIGDLGETQRILTSTADALLSNQCGPATIPNNVYGWGRVNAYRAVQAARVDVPWLVLPQTLDLLANTSPSLTVTFDARQVLVPGGYTARLLIVRHNVITPIAVSFDVRPADSATAHLTGRIADRWTQTGIYARADLPELPHIYPDPRGVFSLTLPLGPYPFTLTADGYLSQTTLITLTADTTQDFLLTPDTPHLILSATPLISATLPFGARANFPITLTNDGTQPLTLTASLPPQDWSVEEFSTTALYDLSAFPALALGDDMIYTDTLALGFKFPFYDQMIDRLYLSSNGWVSTVEPDGPASGARCLPTDRLPRGGLLAPFWADLDPSVGGVVRAGQIASDTYVISFENVPPWQENPGPNPPTYTFQLAFHLDGRAEFVYGAMGELPVGWGVGAMLTLDRYQNLACELNPKELTGTTLTLRAQPPPALWLSATPVTRTIQPGSTAVLTAMLLGSPYVSWRSVPYTATLSLLTNDSTQAQIDWPTVLDVGAPPYQLWMPVTRR